MQRLNRNECIVALHDFYIESLWEMTDEELAEEFTTIIEEETPFYYSIK